MGRYSTQVCKYTCGRHCPAEEIALVQNCSRSGATEIGTRNYNAETRFRALAANFESCWRLMCDVACPAPPGTKAGNSSRLGQWAHNFHATRMRRIPALLSLFHFHISFATQGLVKLYCRIYIQGRGGSSTSDRVAESIRSRDLRNSIRRQNNPIPEEFLGRLDKNITDFARVSHFVTMNSLNAHRLPK